MAIRPVSGISFNNYSFEGKNKKTNPERHSGHTTSPLKAIPLAALIALSPMAKAESAVAKELQTPKIETVQNLQKKVVLQTRFAKADVNGTAANIDFISTDGDDENAEVVAIKFSRIVPYKSEEGVKGYRIEINGLKNLKGLKIENVTEYRDAEKKSHKFKRYYITGEGSCFLSQAKDGKGRVLDKSKISQITKIEINENFYNYLKDILEDSITYEEDTVEEKTYEYLDEQDYIW